MMTSSSAVASAASAATHAMRAAARPRASSRGASSAPRRAAVAPAVPGSASSSRDDGIVVRRRAIALRRRSPMTPHPAFLSPFETAVADAPASDAASAKKKKTKGALRLRIDGEWYDCTGWAKAHPGGSLFITLMDGCDATDVFYALHSYGPNGDDLAARRLAMLPRCDGPEEEEEEEEEEEGGREIAAPSIVRNPNHTIETKPGNADANFATLRKKFEDEGWFARDPLKEASVLCQVLGLYALGWFLAWTHPILASLSLGLGMQQAGWLAHDYIHGRGKWCTMMRGFGSLTNGFSTEWWQHKHNMHHSFTNIDGRDGDIKLEPLYYLQDPKVTGRNDNPGLRKWQHWYGYPLYAATYALWRRHSMASAIARRDKKELTLLGIHYAWLFLCLPWQVAVSSVLIGGFLVGSLVTATHQTEEIMFEQGGEFVDIQFRSTREADVKGLEAWLWGGMDTQLVHHLFPTMPRYRHHEARPVIRKWAEEHGYDFRISSSWEILSKNFNHLKELAHI